MANVARSAKSASEWTNKELIAYNITIASISPDKFFPNPDPSLDHIDPAILSSPPGIVNPAHSNVAAAYLGYLDLATRVTQQCFVNDFAAETLKLLAFNERGTTVSTRYTIPLTICGKADRVAQADVCLIRHRSVFILLVLINLADKTNADAQVVARAIAAFQFNNSKRREYGLDPQKVMTIPCIAMSGTRPTFYLVPVTTGLSSAVITGKYPATRTRVLRCNVAAHTGQVGTGMEDKEYRKLALKRFLAFKVLAKSHWASILKA